MMHEKEDLVGKAWLERVWVRYNAINNGDGLHVTVDNGGSPQQTELRFKTITEGIRFSRRWAWTYQAALVAVLLIFTVAHFLSVLKRKVRRREAINSEAYMPDNGLVLPDEEIEIAWRNGARKRTGSSSGSSTPQCSPNLTLKENITADNKSAPEEEEKESLSSGSSARRFAITPICGGSWNSINNQAPDLLANDEVAELPSDHEESAPLANSYAAPFPIKTMIGGDQAIQAWSRTPCIKKQPSSHGSSDDRTPLLPTNDHFLAQVPGRRLNLMGCAKAAMMYQPRPIPFIYKTLPCNAVSFSILCFVGLNAFFLFFNTPLSVMTIFVFADRAGLLFVANLPVLYLFSAKNQPISILTGYSYEYLNIFHRRLGEIMCLLAFLHSGAMTVVWYTILRPVGWSFGHFLKQPFILLGLFAVIFYECLYFTSLGSFRQRGYEWFLFIHVLLQLGALVFLFLHHPGSRIYVGVALAIFLVDRLLFRLKLKVFLAPMRLTFLEHDMSVKLDYDWSVPSQKPWFGWMYQRSICYGWKPTQHVFLTIPSLGGDHYLQAHPFTIASAAPNYKRRLAPSNTLAHLNFIVRGHKGFTKDLTYYTKPQVDVKIDGPYGSTHAVDMLLDSDVAVVVAGGSGIAVAYPLLKAILSDKAAFARMTPKPYVIPGVENNFSRLRGGEAKKICFIWVVHHERNFNWIPKVVEEVEIFRKAGVEVIMPRPTCEAGRPVVGDLVRAWVDTRAEPWRKNRVGVVVSGPGAMNREVRNVCASMASEGVSISVAVENFGW